MQMPLREDIAKIANKMSERCACLYKQREEK